MIISNAAIRHRTTVFVLMVIIVIMGVTAYYEMPRESDPDITIPFMNVIPSIPGWPPVTSKPFSPFPSRTS